MIKATIDQLKEAVTFTPRQIENLKMFEELQELNEKYRKLVKNSPVIGVNEWGEPVYQIEIDIQKKNISILLEGIFDAPINKKDRLKEILDLKKEGYKNVYIAQKLGITEGAVRKWLKKG